MTFGHIELFVSDSRTSREFYQSVLGLELVDVKVTTGCGDVFQGAYVLVLAYGMPVEKRMPSAGAAAALKAALCGLFPNRHQVQELVAGSS